MQKLQLVFMPNIKVNGFNLYDEFLPNLPLLVESKKKGITFKPIEPQCYSNSTE